MKVGILASQAGWHVARLQEALERRRVTVERFSSTRLLARVASAHSSDKRPRGSQLRAQVSQGERDRLSRLEPNTSHSDWWQAHAAGSSITQATTIELRALARAVSACEVSAGPRVSFRGQPLDDCAALLVRGIPIGSLEQIIFRVDVLHRLENLGVKVINSAGTIEKTVDKYYTSTLLEDGGLPTPRTVVTERFDEAMEAFLELGGDVVVKPLFGSEGHGMLRVNDEDLAHRIFRALELGRYVYYLQEYIAHGNRDIRAFVVGDRVVAAMARRGTSWKTNVAQGARAEPFILNSVLEELSLKASHLVGADYAGVDILCSEEGQPYVIEVNGIPGWRGLQSTTNIDIADKIVEHVFERLDA